MRPLILVLLLLVAPVMARPYTVEQMLAPFDARVLTAQEKRLLQTGLAFSGHYNGMIDGDWGEGSQRALERHVQTLTGETVVTNMAALLVVLETFALIEEEGWERQHNSTLDLSFLVPTQALRAGTPSDTFANMTVRGRSIGYSLTVSDGPETAGFHDYTLRQAVGVPYTLRRPLVWVTSVRTATGISLYIRSDFRRGRWSTIMVSARDDDAGAFAAITGSIAPGHAPAIGISPGLLSAGIETLARVLADEEGNEAPRLRRPPKEAGGMAASTPAPATGFGTGFVVSSAGHVLTNRHVVNGCRRVTVDGRPAALMAEDRTFDLALLRGEGLSGVAPAVFALEPARLNSDVTVAGFPLPDLLGGLNVTRGAVTSLKGLGGDGINMQISAPVQPGNSGGPVLNAAGQVVGVVVAKLDAGAVARLYDDIPQNVNFAIRGEIAKLFLAQNGVDPLVEAAGIPVAPEDLAETAAAFTRLVACN